MSNEFIRGRLYAKNMTEMEGFYRSVFADWRFKKETVNGTEYLFISTGNGPGGEMVTTGGKGWIPFADVDDVEIALKAAQRNGGSIVENKTKFVNGYYGIFKDPEGSVIGVWGKK